MIYRYLGTQNIILFFQIVIACLVFTLLTGTLSIPVENKAEHEKNPVVDQQHGEEGKPIIADQPHIDHKTHKDEEVGVKKLPEMDIRVAGKDGTPQVAAPAAGEIPKDLVAGSDAKPAEPSGASDLETANTFWGGKWLLKFMDGVSGQTNRFF